MSSNKTKTAVIAAVSTLWPIIAPAQTAGADASDGGVTLTYGLNSTLRTDSNYALVPGSTDSATIFDNKLSFGLKSVTSAYQLSIQASGVLRYADLPAETLTGFQDPTLTASYSRENDNSKLTFDGSYRHMQRAFYDPFSVEQEAIATGDLFEGGGTLTDRRAHLRYETGLASALGFVGDLDHRDRSYSDLSNPRVYDTTTNHYLGSAILRFGQSTAVNLTAQRTDYSAEDANQTDRTTDTYSIGVVQDLNAVMTFEASLGESQVTTDSAPGGIPQTVQSSGTVGMIGLSQDMGNGRYYGRLNTDFNENGSRNTLIVGRDVDLPDGKLIAYGGVSGSDLGSTVAVGRLSYTRELPTGALTVFLDRQARTNDASEEVVDSRASLRYRYDVNPVSSLGLGMDYALSADNSNSGLDDVSWSGVTASYSHQVAENWELTGGATLRHRNQTSTGSAQSTALFLSLDHQFSVRP